MFSKILWGSTFKVAILVVLSTFDTMTASAEPSNTAADTTSLRSVLSKNASIYSSLAAAGAPRWSDFDAPLPGTVVNVATENDVLQTVKYAVANNLPVMAQSGAHGWAETFHLGHNGVVINLRGLNSVVYNGAIQQPSITFGGGSIISELIKVADANGAHVPTGNCNDVGALGAILGGGVGHLMGLYGLGVDNLISFNLVTSQGELLTVNCSNNPDLWWAVRGAGPNFGIVTSATIKAYPRKERIAWTGNLFFTEDKIEQIVTAINDLNLGPQMSIFLLYVTLGAPDFTPAVLVAPFYLGNATEGAAAFSSILNIGPYMTDMAVYNYTSENFANDALATKGGRKPSYGAGLAQLVPATWRAIWNEYTAYVNDTRYASSSVFVECYSYDKARQFPDSSSSYPFRSTINYTSLVNNWYANDTSLDAKAEAFGTSVRNLWRQTDGLTHNSTYINFAFGDEPLETIYGGNVARLQQIKKTYDPKNVFNQWFPLN